MSQRSMKSRQANSFNELSRSFGLGVQRRRVELSWSVQQLADQTGLDRALVEQIESGDANPRANEMVALAHALGAKVAEFFE